VHEQQLAVTQPIVRPLRLVFGAGRLLQAETNALVVRDTVQGDSVLQAPLEAVRALAQGSDGALFALGLSGGVRLEPRSTQRKNFAQVVFLPGSNLFPDLEEPSHFYVYYSTEQQLYRYSFDAEGGAFLAIEAQIPLNGCDAAGPLTQLRDSAFVCRSAHAIIRKAPRGGRSEFKFPAGVGQPSWLLPAKRFDELFSVSQSGEVVHWRLDASRPVLGRFQLPAPPFAAAANTDALAFILASAPEPGQPRRWTLHVTDFDGQLRLDASLPEREVTAGEDWLERLIADKNLAISGFEPLVAVGGAERVTVWNYAQGRQVFSR
jgi:hypothetical protein